MKTAELNSQKRDLRARYLGFRKTLGEAARKEKSAAVSARLLSTLDDSKSKAVMVYRGMGSEVDASAFMRAVIGSGRPLALPYCLCGREMGVARVYDLENDLENGPFGTVQPKRELWGNISIDEIDVCICPGVAFDRYGTRLGRGGGFYDSFLRDLKGRAVITGCCFECQISGTALPRERHDISMDYVVSENGPLLLEPICAPQSINTFSNGD